MGARGLLDILFAAGRFIGLIFYAVEVGRSIPELGAMRIDRGCCLSAELARAYSRNDGFGTSGVGEEQTWN
jgi:hypothetical protein